eukprot:2497149-Pleurochrysis_carterae.AAC.3
MHDPSVSVHAIMRKESSHRVCADPFAHSMHNTPVQRACVRAQYACGCGCVRARSVRKFAKMRIGKLNVVPNSVRLAPIKGRTDRRAHYSFTKGLRK